MSDWKERARDRKEARQSKGPDESPPIPAKKDKKRWCGGHVGREHEKVCMPYDNTQGIFKNWRVLACKNCGKRFEFYYPFGHWKKSKPTWVTS